MSIRSTLAIHLASLAIPSAALHAEDKPDPAKAPPPPGLLAPEGVVAVGARVALLEGPAFDGDGHLFFSDIFADRIYRMAPDGKVSIFRADSGRTNGNTFDARGRLISCEGAEQGPGGGRRVVRTDLGTGKVEVLTDRYRGRRYNSPNDAVADARGRTWFTDPFYGDDRSALEMDAEAVYRIDPDGGVTRVLSGPEVERPNGIALTPDGRTLYVVDSHSRPGGNRKVWAFDVDEDGGLGRRRQVFDFGKGRGGDGLRLDERGNLWVAAGIMFPRNAGESADVPPGVYVITPGGELLGRVPIPEDLCTNLAFGGPGRRTLHVTAGKSIYKVPLTVSGYALYPPPGH